VVEFIIKCRWQSRVVEVTRSKTDTQIGMVPPEFGISLPEGSGMGEKFTAHPVSGIGSMTAHTRGTSPNLRMIWRIEE